jgi:hypothetical protein
MASFLILTTVLALSGIVSVAMAWAVLGTLLYVMQTRAAAAAAATAKVPVAPERR